MGSANRSHTATLLPNGKVLVAGGSDSNGVFPHAEVFDPATETWSDTGTLVSARSDHMAILLPNGKVLIAGGADHSGYLSSAELYDPASGTWAATGAMNSPRAFSRATLLPNGKVLVAGGLSNSGVRLSSSELFDPLSETWTMTGAMADSRYGHTATLLPSGKVLVAGGYHGDGGSYPGAFLSNAEIYDPATGLWTATGAMNAARYNFTATLLPNGKVLVAGGYSSTGDFSSANYLSGAEIYDPVTGAWTTTGSMSNARNVHTADLLPSGKVLVAGGVNYSSILPIAELYDPATGFWTATGTLSSARWAHTSTMLPIGKALVTGGLGIGGVGLSSAEIYSSTCTISLSPAAHGTITGNTSPYLSAATATLTATPAPGYLFTGWAGDATGTTNPFSVLMDSDKTITATFTPDTNDTDADGLTNYQEIVEYGTDPTKQDTDNDGVKDSTDALPLDPAETLDSDHDGIGDNTETDDDNDGLSDVDEINTHHTNPKLADSDGDGLSDADELQVHTTNPNIADTDNDGLNDGDEFLTHHTNPKVNDTDADGFLDGYEVLTGKSPLDIADHPALVAEARTAIEFTFPAALGKTYRIEDSPDLATWTTVESGIAGTGQLIQRFYTTRGMPMRYFRVEEDGL